jgi:hypothetical protein
MRKTRWPNGSAPDNTALVTGLDPAPPPCPRHLQVGFHLNVTDTVPFLGLAAERRLRYKDMSTKILKNR